MTPSKAIVLGMLLVALLALAGCAEQMPARFGPPTLTPIYLPTASRAPVATVVAQGAEWPAATPVPTRTPRAGRSPEATPETVPATGNAVASPSPAAPVAPVTVQPTATPNAARPAVTRPSATTGSVVFQAATGGEIYLLTANGLRLLTHGLDPALSPDGTRVAFARWGNAPGIYVLDLGTGEERRVAGAERPRSPSWSSDGARIVFSRFLGSTSCRQSPFGCLTEDELRVRFGGKNCLPSPAGTLCIDDFPRVALEQSGLTETSADGQGWTDLPAPQDAQSPAWKPGADEIAFLGGGRLQLTGRDRQPQPLEAEPWTLSPAWSVDGSRMVAQRRVHDNWDLVLLDGSGTTIRQLTATESDEVAPTWSPDGKRILFLSNRDGRWRLYTMAPDGSGTAPYAADTLRSVEIRYDYAAERVASWGR